MKLITKFLLPLLLLCSTLGHASIITTPLTADDFVSYNGLDWAWAAPVNEQFWDSYNELKLPEFHDGWRFATSDEMSILLNDLGLSAFTRANGSYIQAVAYWNTVFTHVDALDFYNNRIASAWGNDYYETFYVRESVQPVPEPATILVFGVALLGFIGLRRVKN